MTTHDKKTKSTTPAIFTIVGILIIVGVLADSADVIAYNAYLSQHGISIGSILFVPPDVWWPYVTSPLGLVLSTLGLAPWIVLLAWSYWPKKRETKGMNSNKCNEHTQ